MLNFRLCDLGNRSDSSLRTEHLGMNRCGQRAQAGNERWSRRVQQFVGDAVDTAISTCAGIRPSSFIGGFGEWNSISCSAPCSNNHFGIIAGDFFGRAVSSGSANEFSAGSVDEFSNPRLRGNDRFSPFFAKTRFLGRP